ncbi:hypothetical protein OK016_28710 [Vibrio chagasii]|nr:hypothetical protein [Vibrio chagasii]
MVRPARDFDLKPQLDSSPTWPKRIINTAILRRAGAYLMFPKVGIGYNNNSAGRHAGEDYLERKMHLLDS